MNPAAENVPAERRGSALRSPRVVFIVLSLLGLLSQTAYPKIRHLFGLLDHGMWFLDSYAVLASSDADRAGVDPDTPNPYDVFQRSHKYSDWWFVLGQLGLTRADNFLVGGVWVMGFLIAVFATVVPRSRAEAIWLALLVASPPVMLGILRANNDLVIFTILAVALIALRRPTGTRIGIALATLALATGLKFYPIVAAGAVLLIPESRWRYRTAGFAALTLLAVVVAVWPQIARGTFHIEPQIHTFGSRIFFLDLGFNARAAAWLSPFLFVLVSGLLVRVHQRSPVDLGFASTPSPHLAMAMGAALLVICFMAGTNYAYRFIFALWVANWCWSHRKSRSVLRLGVWLLPIALWQHGALCAATALWFPDLLPEQYDRILFGWRLATEPLTWLLFALLGSWWLHLGFMLLQEQRTRRRS